MANWEAEMQAKDEYRGRGENRAYGPQIGTLDGSQAQLGRISLPTIVENFSGNYQHSQELLMKLEQLLYRLTGEPNDPRVERADTPNKGIQSPLHQLNDLHCMLSSIQQRSLKIIYQISELL